MNSDTIFSIVQEIRFQALEEGWEVSEVLDVLEERFEDEFNFYD